jgi:asparagine synthase (glutamine-hydrolysing)
MCGICGVVLRDPAAEVDPLAIGRMTDALAHRGPDDRRTALWGHVAFGHRRLSIIDLEGGAQPMSTPDGQVTVVFNGALYNYLELRADLIQQGVRPRTFSDTEVLLHLYVRHGVEMFQWMNGMFAFAVYDARERRLLLARDRFGEKPLYYFQDGSQLLFASEVKAILEAPGVQAEPDEDALQEYLTFQYCQGDRTLFRGIRRVPPASYIVASDQGEILERREYWTLGFEEDHTRPEPYYVDELRFLLEDAVKIRLRSDVPVGAYLSGGVDSSVVTAFSSKLLGRGLPAFTGYFEEGGGQYNEVSFATEVARAHHCPHHTIRITAADFAAEFRRLIYHMDEPAAGPGAFPQLMVSTEVAKRCKVVLGGQGGDELFGGYARYLMLYLEECLKGAIFESQDPVKHVVTLDHVLPNLTILQRYVPMLTQFWSRGLFEPVERRYFAAVARIPDLNRYFTADFLASRNEERIFSGFERQFNDILRHVSTGGSALFNRMTAYDMRTSLQALLHVEDRMSMAASVESRLPLLDHRIAELMFKTPPRFKYRDGKSKSLLLLATRTLLPDTVLHRKDKMGFPVPFVEWARGPLRDFVSDILLGRAARERGIYRPEGIEALLDAERPFGRELWGLLSLETWFQTFIDA